MDPTATCQWLSARLYRLLDERDYDALADLFAPDGVWHRQGKALRGPSEIRAALAERSARLAIRHLLTSVDVLASDAETIEVFGYVLVIRSEDESNEAGPSPMPTVPSSLLMIRDRFVSSDGAWRLIDKSGRRVFAST